jgi:alpha/beta superfamily hydrolase
MAGSQKLFMDGLAGSLEGLWMPAGEECSDRVVVLCHPHPLHGGTMETKLVARTARKLSESGFCALRFNFRGVGQSEGTWDEGRGERDDLRSVLDYVLDLNPNASLTAFGFSFGAWVALDVGADHPAIGAIVAVAPPIQHLSFDGLAQCTKPKLIVCAGRDEIVDPDGLADWAESLADPKQIVVLPEADHLFTKQSDEVARSVLEFCTSLC